ncbi:MAG: DUF1002 domain-containing protein [Chloroflexota bacterium]|nr:DUF1002 domain-containing protein [Chloroflexota bacterium]
MRWFPMLVTSRTRYRLTRALGLLVFMTILLTPAFRSSFAAEGGKTIALGESLNDAQKQELLALFGSGSADQILTVTEADTQAAMAGVTDQIFRGAFSSTALTCRDLGDGLIVRTSNITSVTPGLYAMALVTAGLGDGELIVAAPSTATSLGLTALTGVFKTWAIAPCESGDTTPERQRLALEELTLTLDIGQAVGNVQAATNIVIETQRTLVTDGLVDSGAIGQVIDAHQAANGVVIPADLRAELVGLMTRLAAEQIDWSTFSAGWTIVQNAANTEITMTGDGIAIRNARATATAEAGAMMTATAEAAAALTATAEARGNQATADAQATIDALATQEALNRQATQQAIAAMTATAAAQPTATPVPPVAVSGQIITTDGKQIVVDPTGSVSEPVTFEMDDNSSITREGKSADAATLAKGDRVEMSVDGVTNVIVSLSAQPAPESIFSKLQVLWPLLLLGLVAPVAFWAKGRKPLDPFMVKRIHS